MIRSFLFSIKVMRNSKNTTKYYQGFIEARSKSKNFFDEAYDVFEVHFFFKSKHILDGTLFLIIQLTMDDVSRETCFD